MPDCISWGVKRLNFTGNSLNQLASASIFLGGVPDFQTTPFSIFNELNARCVVIAERERK